MSERGSAARHTFYYLLILVTLGFTALGVGQILFQVINALFPETTYTYEAAFDEWVLRFGITAVVVSAPIFFLCTRAVNRELANGKLDLHSLVRKWLTYLILLLASITLIVDLMVTFYSFLSGELTSKFILKALVIGGIAAFMFVYYLYDITREKFVKDDKRIRLYRHIFIGVIVATLVAGFYFNTSPGTVRAEREDSERVSRLSSIHYQIENYYQDNAEMPEDLETIRDLLYDGEIEDPVTEEPFEYRVVDENTYSICADFAFSNRERDDRDRYYGWRDADWLHDAGRQCFEKSVERTGDVPVITPDFQEVPVPPRA